MRPGWPAGGERSAREVHVWHARLDVPPSIQQQLQVALSADERRRAERFYFQRERRRFVVARGLLRVILGRYAGTAPVRLRFSYGSHGKPVLANTAARESLQFNLSHSHELVAYAIARGRRVGIDVERVRPVKDLEALAQRFFSARENAALQALPREQRQEAFYECWTCKEAYVKACGEGLSVPLDAFDVPIGSAEPAVLCDTRGDPHERTRWTLQRLAISTNVKAALATEGPCCPVTCRPWPMQRLASL